jgi:hypothetical protein
MLRGGLAGLAALALAAAPSAAARTRVISFTPFTKDGAVKRKIRTVKRSGTCRFDSRLVLRDDAWRCRTGRRRRDPCFDNPVIEDQVVCVKAPWSRSGALIDTPLDDSDRAFKSGRRPWAVKVGRRRCLFKPGSKRKVHGKRLDYTCGRRGPFLFGLPNRHRATWTIRIAETRRGKGLKRAKIRVAWR